MKGIARKAPRINFDVNEGGAVLVESTAHRNIRNGMPQGQGRDRDSDEKDK